MGDNISNNKKVDNDEDFNYEIKIDETLKRIFESSGYDEDENVEIGDCFNENILSSVNYGIKDGKKFAYFPCDTCKKNKSNY